MRFGDPDCVRRDIKGKAVHPVWSSGEAEIVTGGRSSQPWRASGIAMTLADLRPGDLFVASPQDDLDEVFKKGAACVMTDFGDGAHPNLPILKVSGTYEALKSLARAARFRTHARVIAVQGKDARVGVGEVLTAKHRVHMAGRHLSLSLAGLPDDVEFGVFGLSPAVEPDIAVITDCSLVYRDTLFERMPRHGAVLIHDDGSDAVISVVARVRAAGLSRIYTYSDVRGGRDVDVRYADICTGSNGVRVSLAFGEMVETLNLPRGRRADAHLLAAMMILKLSDCDVQDAVSAMSGKRVRGDGAGDVSLIDPAMKSQDQAAFRVTNMIDLGGGNQTVILDNIIKERVSGDSNSQAGMFTARKGFAIPPRLDNLSFVYTSKSMNTSRDARGVIAQRHKGAKLASITPDVVAPGDFLVFDHVRNIEKTRLAEALRLIPNPAGRRLANEDRVVEYAV